MSELPEGFVLDQSGGASGRAPTRITVRPDGGGMQYAPAIAKIESGGRYDQLGPTTRTGDKAFGKYQVMGANVGPWTQEVLGQSLTPEQFLASPEAQDAVFDAKFGAYAKKYGPEGAARAWFAGEGGMNDPNRRDILGTSVADYGRKFSGANGSAPPQMTEASAQARQAPALPPGFVIDSAPQMQAPAAAPAQAAPAAQPQGQPYGPQPRQVGMGEAVGLGAANSATFGFRDELGGASAAGMQGLDLPAGQRVSALATLLSIPIGAARMLYESYSGSNSATKAYEGTRDDIRAQEAAAQQQQPGAYMTGQVGGAVALPMGGMLNAATMPARIGRSAAVGAAFGGLTGAGEGTDLQSRATGAASGAAMGGVFGAVAPVAIKGVELAAGAAGKLVAPFTQAGRGMRDPEAEAARKILQVKARDARTGQPGLSDAEMAAARERGQPVANVDQGGAATLDLARSAANTSAEGRSALELLSSDRYASQNKRTSAFLKDTFDFPEVGPALDRLEAAAQAANRPAYAKAYAQGQAIWDEGLAQFSQAPVMQQAIRMAFVTGRNRAALDGFPPIKNPFVMNRETGVLELQPGSIPNLQFWDHVKQNLDKLGPEGQAFSRALRGHLDDIVPSYADARSGAAKFFGAEDAMGAGAKFAAMTGSDAMKLAEARKGLAMLKPAERKLFETGFVANLIAKIESRTDGQDIVKAIYNTETAKKQIELALGKDKAALVEAHLLTERAMNGLKGALGNSTTARQLYELGMAGATNPYTLASAAGAATAYGSGNVGFGDALAAGLVFGARKGQIRIDERVARRVGEMLASNNPEILQKGVSLVARNENFRKALLNFTLPTARAGGQQGANVAPLQAMGIGRADEDQPNVPGP